MTKKFIKPEYLNAASVVFVFFALVMPWSVIVTTLNGGRESSASIIVVFIRWPFIEIRRVLGIELPTQFYTPLSGYQLHAQANDPIATGYIVWGIGAIVFLIAVILMVATFVKEQRTEELLPFPIARAIGGSLLLSSILFMGALITLLVTGFDGMPIPLGVLFMAVFGVVLLINELGTDANQE